MINSATFKKAHKKLLKPLEVDQAQAASESAFSDTVTTLKEIHGTQYIAADVHWGMWANEILSGEAHLIDHAINNPPPMHLSWKRFLKVNFRQNVHLKIPSLEPNIQLPSTKYAVPFLRTSVCLWTLKKMKDLEEYDHALETEKMLTTLSKFQ
ncbi:hypothetical protein HDU78_011846 [Chytriomyces hyalinus]|nr:hypothetical protein HDU78_011846 [Chytriomyces hyalinus]